MIKIEKIEVTVYRTIDDKVFLTLEKAKAHHYLFRLDKLKGEVQ